ncbi:MAG: COX15/CtaA family protein [Burkholderiaceae bacterium]|nr:COX15/CtaA family protein [Burkholderiaceae bacterium]
MRRVALVACLLTVCITAASAYIRHWQAGLGCAQRADCRIVATDEVAAGQVQSVQQAIKRVVSAEAPAEVSVARALHRVSATTVGVLVVVIAFVGWSRLANSDRRAIVVAVALTLALSWIGLYAALATLPVTAGNVLGGFALGAALAWIAAGRAPALSNSARRTRGSTLAWGALGLAGTIALIGVVIAARETVDLDAATLHLAHRILAFAFAALTLAVLAASGRRAPVLGAALATAAFAQIALGLTNAFSDTPLVAATAHNAVAALIVAMLAAIARRAGNVRTGQHSIIRS